MVQSVDMVVIASIVSLHSKVMAMVDFVTGWYYK